MRAATRDPDRAVGEQPPDVARRRTPAAPRTCARPAESTRWPSARGSAPPCRPCSAGQSHQRHRVVARPLTERRHPRAERVVTHEELVDGFVGTAQHGIAGDAVGRESHQPASHAVERDDAAASRHVHHRERHAELPGLRTERAERVDRGALAERRAQQPRTLVERHPGAPARRPRAAPPLRPTTIGAASVNGSGTAGRSATGAGCVAAAPRQPERQDRGTQRAERATERATERAMERASSRDRATWQ